MAAYNGHLVFQVTDINGDTATLRIPVPLPDTTTIANLATELGVFEPLIAALTNGKITRQGFSVLVNEAQFLVGTTPPVDAEYSSVTDGAKLQFASGNGDRASVTIPAPIEAMFGANSNVVDSTQTDTAAFIAQYKTSAGTEPGPTVLNLYKGGIKVGKRARRRRSALIP